MKINLEFTRHHKNHQESDILVSPEINLASCVFFCSCLVLSLSAKAQEVTNNVVIVNSPPRQQSSNDTTQQVEIKAKNVTENLKYSAVAKSIVTSEQLSRFGDNNVFDGLKHVPGIVVSNDSISLPGLPPGYTKVLIDGELPRGISIKDLSLAMIDRVEISRLGNAEYSSQAIGGTINIILKKNPNTKKNTYKYGISSNQWSIYTMSWYSADKVGNLSYSTNISAVGEPHISSFPTIEKTNEISLNGEENRTYTDKFIGKSYSVTVTPRIQFTTLDGTNLTSVTSITARRSSFNRNIETLLNFGDTVAPKNQSIFANAEFVVANTELKTKTTLFKDIKFEFNIGLNFNLRSSDALVNILNETGQEQKNGVKVETRQSGLSNSGKIILPSVAEHAIVSGWSLSKKSTDFKRIDSIANASYKSDEIRNSATVDNAALFAQDEWQFVGQSSLYLGLRWEALHIQNLLNSQQSLSRQFSVFSPIVQSLWPLDTENQNRIRFGISRAYKPPSEAQLAVPKTKAYINSIWRPQEISNPELRPELAWSLSTEYEHEGKDNWNYNLRFTFRSIKDTQQTYLSYFDNTWLTSTINSGRSLSKLLELESTFPLKQFYRDAPNIDFNFYTYRNWSSNSYLPKPDNVMTPTPWSVSLGADFKSKNFPIDLGARFQRDGSRWVQVNLSNRTYESQSPQLDAYLQWKFDKKTKLRLSVRNFFKRTNNQELDYAGPQVNSFSQRLIQGYRGIQLNFEYQP